MCVCRGGGDIGYFSHIFETIFFFNCWLILHTHTHTHTHTHIHTRTHAPTHARIQARTHAHKHARTHAHTRAGTHAGTHAHTYTHTNARARGEQGLLSGRARDPIERSGFRVPAATAGRFPSPRSTFYADYHFGIRPSPPHPSFTSIARKRSRSFCQKCKWQVTAKHICTLLCGFE